MHGLFAPIITQPPPIVETIYPVADSLVAVWEKDGTESGTTNVYQACNNQSDSDYVSLRLANRFPDTLVCPTTDTRVCRFAMDTPSGTPAAPSSGQNIQYVVRVRYTEIVAATGETVTVTIRLKEGTTTVRSSSSGNSVGTSFGDVVDVITQSEYESITDWSNLYVEVEFEACTGDSAMNAGELDADVSQIYLEFS